MGKEPYFLCTANNPASVPGIPEATAEAVLLPSITFPAASRYMSLVAASGAFSR